MGQLSRLYSKLVFVISTAKSMCLPYSFVHSDKILIIFNSEKYIHGNIFFIFMETQFESDVF